MRGLRLLPVIWLVLLLSVPAIAYVAGARQPLVENRAQRPFPDLNRGTVRNKATFDAFDGALLDRLPGRDKALELRADTEIDIFHDSPNPRVAIGKDGWLYLTDELDTCVDGDRPVSDPADAVDVTARTLLASGRRALVVWPRSKLFTHPQDAPGLDSGLERCARAIEDSVQRRMLTAPGTLVLDPQFRALEARGEPVFLRSDSHWNTRGRELFTRRVLDFIRPGLAEAVGLHAGREIDRPGDLATLMGIDRSDRDRVVVAAHPPANPVPPGDAVLIGDSQLEYAFISPVGKGVAPVRDVALPGQQECNWPAAIAGGCDLAIRKAKTVVIESVARNAITFTQGCWRFVALAAEDLRGASARWRSVQGATPTSHGSVVVPASGSVTVTVRPRTGDKSAIPRLLLLGIRRFPKAAAGAPPSAVTMTQLPQPGAGPVPCATPAQAAVGGALSLPIPAGRPASSVTVQLTAPPGTVLAAPREIALDGHAHVARR